MRILVLTNRVPYPLTDGGAIGMDLFLKGYPEAGCSVRLLAMNTVRHPADPAGLPQVWPGLDHITTVEVDNAVKPLALLRNWAFSRRPSHAERFQSTSFAAALKRELYEFRPDIVHVESPFLADYLPVVREIAPQALAVLRMNNVEAQIWQRLSAGTVPGPKQWYLRSLARRIGVYERAAWKAFDLLLPVTEADSLEAAKEIGAERIHIVPFCIDTIAVRSRPLTITPTAYHLAAMDWRPNVEAVEWFITEVWPRLRAEVPALHVHFAGRHMPDHLLERAEERLHISAAVADAQAFASDKTFLIVPLRSGGGIRVKILEAMAAGIPVLSTTIGLQGIEATPGRDCAVADTATGFAELFKYFLHNSGCVEKMSHNARQLVEQHYNRQKAMAGLKAWLEAALQKHRQNK